MTTNDAFTAGAELIKTGLAVPIRLQEETVLPAPDEAEFGMRLDLIFEDEDGEDDSGTDPEDVVEWGAFGFLFLIGVLSFADARSRGASEIDYNERDEFRLSYFLAALRFRRSELYLDTDYVRGRRMKTRVTVRADGTATIETIGRGKAPSRWIARLKGDRPLHAIG